MLVNRGGSILFLSLVSFVFFDMVDINALDNDGNSVYTYQYSMPENVDCFLALGANPLLDVPPGNIFFPTITQSHLISCSIFSEYV